MLDVTLALLDSLLTRGRLDLGDEEDITFPGIGRTPQMGVMSNSGPSRAWPDGNSSVLRLLGRDA
mgnify:CR=1 FL=1